MKYKIVNIVASGNLNATPDLYNLRVAIPNIEYELEQFPGAILRVNDPKVTLPLFKNGKIICAGAKREHLLEKGLKLAEECIPGKKKKAK